MDGRTFDSGTKVFFIEKFSDERRTDEQKKEKLLFYVYSCLII